MGLDSVELVMTWEEHFGISIPNRLAATLETPRQVIAAIEGILREHPASSRAWTLAEIERDVCEIIVKQIGVTREDFTLDSSFVREMGID